MFGLFRGKNAGFCFCFFRFVLWLFRFHGSPMTGRCPGISTFTCPLTPRTPLCQGGHKASLSLEGDVSNHRLDCLFYSLRGTAWAGIFGFSSSFPFRVFGLFRGKKAGFCFFSFCTLAFSIPWESHDRPLAGYFNLYLSVNPPHPPLPRGA